MHDITVKDFVKYANAELLQGKEETVLRNFKKDTREIEKGDTYLGIQGENFNRRNIF